MKFDEAILYEARGRLSCTVWECLRYTQNLIEEESEENGDYQSIQDFVTRMLKANLDIHAFSVLAEYGVLELPNNADATMLRPVLALMGYDPDYTAAPDVEVYSFYDCDEELPFN